MKTTKVMIMSDLHCGHLVGLTPPSRHATLSRDATKAQKALEKTRLALWGVFASEVASRPRPDILVVNGDSIDGDGGRSGGSELLTTDPQEQADMAAECIKFVKAPKVYMTYGTPYHTGVTTDFEQVVQTLVKESRYNKECHLKSHLYLKVNDLTFDVKHKIGSSGIPHGRHTAIAKERLWAGLWDEIGVAPKADVFIRSHVHYANYCGGPGHLAMTTPALQGLGSKYGTRQCSGIVNWGYTYFEIPTKGKEFSWELVTPSEANVLQKVEVLKA